MTEPFKILLADETVVPSTSQGAIMKTLLLLASLVLVGGLVLTAEPALAQGCYTQTYMINGKILICTICPGFTSCN